MIRLIQVNSSLQYELRHIAQGSNLFPTRFIKYQCSYWQKLDVFGKKDNPFGITWEDWTVRYWRWLLSMPKDTNPANDSIGRDCGKKQDGPVWFLAGTTGGGSVVRTCDIPSGRGILLQVIATIRSNAKYDDLKSESELRSLAQSQQDKVTEASVTLNGESLSEVVRIQSHLFDLTLPENNLLGLRPGRTQAISDGRWVFFRNLAPGFHKINSSARELDPVFRTEVTYHINSM